MQDFSHLEKLCKLVRYDILTSTTKAGSGHPTSSLSATELMATLFFGGFLKHDLENQGNPLNDRVIFSKGHASPLLYALYHAAGVISSEELLTYRSFNSVLEGHPTPRFPFVDVATGSLGQGLSIGAGMALGAKLKMNPPEPTIWVLLGDSEMAEGQIWEAIEIASYYKLDNLIGIVDVNRLGQRGETMLGWDLKTYKKRVEAFGWKTVVIDDGNDLQKVYRTYQQLLSNELQPKMIIAKTVKGKGISFLEDKNGWHGVPVPKDRLDEALKELGKVDLGVRGKIEKPNSQSDSESRIPKNQKNMEARSYKLHELVGTREAYGDALITLGQTDDRILVIDPEISNSAFAEKFRETIPERFFEVFIAEQNAISMLVGLEKMGFIPYLATFSAFFSRAIDQIRMAQYSRSNLRLMGTHAGVFVGQDGPSQIGLEDIALMRSILQSTILYPADAQAAYKLLLKMRDVKGISYIRTTRNKTPIIYGKSEEFEIGGSKVLRHANKDTAAIIGAGVTLHEALKAYEELKKRGILVSVVDLYSVKPIDSSTLKNLATKIKHFVVVEDHYPFGGVGEAVKSVLSNLNVSIHHLAVKKIPRSAKPEELLRYEEIDASAIVKKVLEIKKDLGI